MPIKQPGELGDDVAGTDRAIYIADLVCEVVWQILMRDQALRDEISGELRFLASTTTIWTGRGLTPTLETISAESHIQAERS